MLIVNSSDVVGWSATRIAAWLPNMLKDQRYRNVTNLEARIKKILEDLHAIESELSDAERGKRRVDHHR